MPDLPPPPTARLGRWALAASGLGLTCLPVLGSGIGLALGVIALRRRARGQPEGALTASIAITLGIAGLLLVAATARLLLERRPYLVAAPPPSEPGWMPSPPPPVGEARRAGPAGSATRASRDAARIETTIGPVRLVDLPDRGVLRELLGAEADEAKRAGEALVLYAAAEDCKPCNGFAVALADARLQRALGASRFVRVDVAARTVELQRLGVPVEKVPGFALLGADSLVRDYVNGGEWGADVAENIAPVLGPFLAGKLAQRKFPFRSPTPRDLTTL
ncbi:MAG: DUF4190 domain-containing protein [Polyangiaceae bacterium]|nr:DUF4190 domain-containing protein [Polyangiaceae bacterium]